MNRGLYEAMALQSRVSWRYCGKPLARAPKDPMSAPTEELTANTRLRFSGVHFSASRASSTGLNGPPPWPPPADPPDPTLAIATASKMKTKPLKNT